MIKQLIFILVLGATLAGTVNLSGPVWLDPVDRSTVNSSVSRETETATPEVTAEMTSTIFPECPDAEFYNLPMERCWPIDTPEPEITITPTWGDDIQATMDADPYDNDYQYIDICWEYVDGGTRIIYYP